MPRGSVFFALRTRNCFPPTISDPPPETAPPTIQAKNRKILLAVVSQNGKARRLARENKVLAFFVSHFDFSTRPKIDGDS
jgi:hypothetical protein